MDERDKKHKAISERNALWGILIVLVIGVIYDVATTVPTGIVKINPFIFSALIVGVLIKGISNYILDKKD